MSEKTGGQVERREFLKGAAMVGAGLAAPGSAEEAELEQQTNDSAHEEAIKKERIRRAMLAGPSAVTADATVAEIDAHGNLTVLRQGTNDWVCIPGNQDIIGQTDMALNPMGLLWLKDYMAGKPKPTNSSPGLIYMLNGATQHSYTDPHDRTSPAIPIGPHWMLIWPFDAKAAGLSSVMRDAGTMVMFAGTPRAHLHICGDPWEGQEYRSGDRGIWTMTYKHS
jgi:hypothetical protein